MERFSRFRELIVRDLASHLGQKDPPFVFQFFNAGHSLPTTNPRFKGLTGWLSGFLLQVPRIRRNSCGYILPV